MVNPDERRPTISSTGRSVSSEYALRRDLKNRRVAEFVCFVFVFHDRIGGVEYLDETLSRVFDISSQRNHLIKRKVKNKIKPPCLSFHLSTPYEFLMSLRNLLNTHI